MNTNPKTEFALTEHQVKQIKQTVIDVCRDALNDAYIHKVIMDSVIETCTTDLGLVGIAVIDAEWDRLTTAITEGILDGRIKEIAMTSIGENVPECERLIALQEILDIAS